MVDNFLVFISVLLVFTRLVSVQELWDRGLFFDCSEVGDGARPEEVWNIFGAVPNVLRGHEWVNIRVEVSLFASRFWAALGSFWRWCSWWGLPSGKCALLVWFGVFDNVVDCFVDLSMGEFGVGQVHQGPDYIVDCVIFDLLDACVLKAFDCTSGSCWSESVLSPWWLWRVSWIFVGLWFSRTLASIHWTREAI